MLKKTADVVRGLAADMVEKAGSGHPGMPIGCADLGAVLFGASAPGEEVAEKFGFAAEEIAEDIITKLK